MYEKTVSVRCLYSAGLGPLGSAGSLLMTKIKVVASFSILGDMVEQVTGDLADVTTIVGPDADAHVYNSECTGDAKGC